MKILIIDEDIFFVDPLMKFLTKEHCLCEFANTFATGELAIVSFRYDLIVTALNFETKQSGLDLIALAQKKGERTAYIILAHENSLKIKLTAFNAGADDLLVKPLIFEELLIRLKSLYRRSQYNGENTILFNEVEVNTTNREVSIHNEIINFTEKEFDIFLFFLTRKNRVLSKEYIAETIWGGYTENLDNHDFIYQHVKNIRRKMKQLGSEPYIKSVYGRGYRFDGYHKKGGSSS